MKKIVKYFIIHIIVIVCVIPSFCSANTYFVDATNGNNANSGISITAPWKTISKVNSSNFQPGDYILFKRGKTWRGQLNIISSGSEGKPITFGAYGTGAPPQVIASISKNNPEEWSKDFEEKKWYASAAIEPADIWCNGSRMVRVAEKIDLDANNEWWWDSLKKQIILFADNNPTIGAKTYEVPQQQYALLINNKNYITVQHITFRFGQSNASVFFPNGSSHITFRGLVVTHAKNHGIWNQNLSENSANNITIEDCEVAWCGGSGVQLGNRTINSIIRRCELHHNSQRIDNDWTAGFRIVCSPDLIYGQTSSKVIVEQNYVHHNGKDARGNNMVSGFRGGGIWFDTTGTNCIIRYNKCHDNAFDGIVIENSDGLECYYNQSNDNGASGIRVECGNYTFPNKNNKIYNNTLVRNRIGLLVAGRYRETNVETALHNEIKNNIIFKNSLRALKAVNGAENKGTINGRGAGNIYTYNCFGQESTGFIEWGISLTYSKYSTWEAAFGNKTYSVTSDPLFFDERNNDFHLKPKSPCIGAGRDVGLTRDLMGNPVPKGQGVDIGAYQQQGLARHPNMHQFPN